jgi:hypothetical protein
LTAQIDSLPEKLSVAKLIVPLAKKIIGSSKLLESHVDVLSSLVSCSGHDSSGRRLIIQVAINQMSSGSKKTYKVLGSWLKTCAERHTEDFKAAVVPLIEMLGHGRIDALENLTQLSLKVLFPERLLTLGSEGR